MTKCRARPRTTLGGGWLVWQHMRGGRPWWWAVCGGAALVGYGFITTLQPPAAGDDFGRLDAAYGGIFIGLSFAWGRAVDGMYLTRGNGPRRGNPVNARRAVGASRDRVGARNVGNAYPQPPR